MIKLNSNKRISKKQLGGFLSDLVTQNAPTIVPRITGVLDSLFNRETESRNFVPAKQVKVNPKDMKDLIEKRRALYGNGNTEYDKFEGITPDLKGYQETLNPEEKRLFSKYKDFYHVNEGLDANGNLMNIDVKKPQSKDAYDPEFDYDKNKGSCKGLGCYELIIDDNRDIIPKDKMRMIRRKSALNLDVIPENYDGIVDEFVNTGIARKLKDRNEPFDIKKHSKMVNEAMKRGDKVFWQKIYQGKDSDFVAGHSGYFTQPYNREDGSQQGLVTFASEGDGLNANHYYDFEHDKRSLDAMGIAVIPKKKKQLGGGVDNTSVERPVSILDIEKNKRDFYKRQLEQNKTYLSEQKDVNPNVKQVFRNEQAKKEANDRINKRQDIVNGVALAASPVPVVGEILGAASGIANGVVDLAQGEYGNAALSAIPYGISKIPFNKLGNKYLPNAYKANPFANKGENGYVDLMRIQEKNGVPLAQLAREGKLSPSWLNSEESAIRLGEKEKHFGEWFTNDKSDIDWYMNDRQFKNPEIINLKVPNSEVGKYSAKKLPTANELSFAPDREFIIPKSEQNNFKPDWLKGYKKIETPVSNFKSEINWSKWNKEIPENTQLMQEYNTIEQTSKASGTWMKNPDGSKFQGTPEQFVQQNSENFKKSFGNSKLINPDGSPTIQYHGSAKKFDTFDENKFQLGDSGYSGQGIYTTPSKTTANSYATSSAKFHKGDIEPTVYELYGQANNPISSSQLIKENKDRDLFNFHRERNWQGELSSYESLKEYDAAISDQLRNVQNIRPWYDAREVVFPTNKQLKSAIGNNGMFDMTNPNIYKALAPLVGAGVVGVKSIQQNKQKFQDGGTIKSDNRGVFKRFFDKKTKPVRDLGRMYSETTKKGYETFDRNYPTVSDKASAVTALTSLIPHPAIKYPSIALNTVIDLANINEDDNLQEIGTTMLKKLGVLATGRSNKLLSGIAKAAEINSDILPEKYKFKNAKLPRK